MKTRAVVIMLAVALSLGSLSAGCSKTTPTAPVATGSSTGAPITAEEGELDAVRQVVLSYWEAFNAYDVEKVLSYMEDSWREERREKVANDIDRMKRGALFIKNVKLGVEVESPPVIIGNGEAEMMIRLQTPIGVKYDYYRLVKTGDEWKVSFSEER